MAENKTACTCPNWPLQIDEECVEGAAPTEPVEHGERETDPAILSGQLRFMAQTLDGERRACVIDAADALDVQRAELARLRRTPETEGLRIVEKHIRHVQASPGASGQQYALRVLDDVRDDLLAAQDPNAGAKVRVVNYEKRRSHPRPSNEPDFADPEEVPQEEDDG